MYARTRRMIALSATTLLLTVGAIGCGGEDAGTVDPEAPATVDPGLGLTEPAGS